MKRPEACGLYPVMARRTLAKRLAAAFALGAYVLTVVFAAPDLKVPDQQPPPGGGTPQVPPVPRDSIAASQAPIKLPGSGDVSDTGAALYSLPLWVPDGPNGMRPDLAISYGGGSGNGPLGVGFALTGLSSIMPCAKTFASEGFADGIDYDATDSYCLDGRKLVPYPDPDFEPPATGSHTVYHTEIESYSRIVAHRVLGTEPQPKNWTVYGADGLIRTYVPVLGTQRGNEHGGTDPHIVNDRIAVLYRLHDIVDRNGNRILYNYDIGADSLGDEVSYRIKSIEYSFAQSATAKRRVEFFYGSRPDPIVQYVRGVKIVTRSRLLNISMWAPNPTTTEKVWSYDLRYATSPDTGRSLLATIQLCEQFGKCSYVRSFDWTSTPAGDLDEHLENEVEFDGESLSYAPSHWDVYEGDYSIGNPPENWVPSTDVRLMLFDADHDGDDDVLYRTKATMTSRFQTWEPIQNGPDHTYPPTHQTFTGTIKFRRSVGGGLSTPRDVTALFEKEQPSNPQTGDEIWIAHLGKSRVADLDGDGRLDFALARTVIEYTQDDLSGWMTDWVTQDAWRFGFTTYYGSQSYAGYPWNPYAAPSLEHVSMFGPVLRYTYQIPASKMIFTPPFQRVLADLDGDSRPEAIDSVENVDVLGPTLGADWGNPNYVHQQGGWPYHTTLSSTGQEWNWPLSWGCNNGQMQVGDFDGDGRDEVLASDWTQLDPHSGENGVFHQLGLGDPLLDPYASNEPHGPATDVDPSKLWGGDCGEADPDLAFGDFNGDGLADALYLPGSLGNNTLPKIRWNLGNGFGRAEDFPVDGELAAMKQDVPTGRDGLPVAWDRGTRVADVDGDGRSDIIAFRQDLACVNTVKVLGGLDFIPPCDMHVYVYRSRGTKLVGSHLATWAYAPVSMAHGFTTAQVGDVTGDGALDIVGVRSGKLVTLELPWRTKPDRLEAVYDSSTPHALETFAYTRKWWGDADKPEAGPDGGPGACPFPQSCSPRGFEVVRTHRVFTGTRSSDGSPMYREQIHTFDGPRWNLTGRGSLGFRMHQIWDRERGSQTRRHFDNEVLEDGDPAPGGQFYPTAGSPTLIVTVTPELPLPSETDIASLNAAPGLVNNQPTSVSVVIEKIDHELRWSAQGRVLAVLPTQIRVEESEHVVAQPTLGSATPTWGSITPKTDRITTTRLEYDDYGNVVEKVVERKPSITYTSPLFVSRTETEYDNRPGDWLIRLPTRTRYTDSDTDDPGHEDGSLPANVVRMHYDAQGRANLIEIKATDEDYGRCPQVIVDPESCEIPGLRIRRTAFDPYGNPTTTVVEAKDDPTPRTYTTKHDNEGVYAVQSTDAKNFATTLVRHPALGVPVLAQNIDQVTTLSQYDGFGRLLMTARPGTATLTRKYETWADGTRRGFTITDKRTSGEETTVQTDELGRPLVMGREGFGGQWTYVEASYDTLGNRVSTSIPTFTPPTAVGTTYVFDRLGRRIKQINPDQSVSTTTPELFKTTTVDPEGHTSYVLRDLDGRVIESGHLRNGEPFGEVKFDYGPLDRVRSIIDAAGNKTLRTYDAFGRLTQLDHPDRGTSIYRYDGFGQLLEERNALGEVITYSYDVLGRIVSTQGPDGVTAHIYDIGPGAAGKLVASTSTDGVSTSIVYDALGRPQQVSQTDNGTTLTAVRRYDSYGRLSLLFYPEVPGFDRFAVHYSYDSAGFLREIRDATGCNPGIDPNAPWPINCVPTPLYLVEIRDARLALKQAKFGNNFIEQRDYDPITGTIERIGAAGKVTRYEYYLDGLVKKRIDIATDRTETFGYDELHRLDWWMLVGERDRDKNQPPPITTDYEYTEIGDVLRVTRDGQPIFDAVYNAQSKPHALLFSTHDLINTYDAKGRLVSADGRTVAWNQFDMPVEIKENGVTRTFRYDANGGRVAREDANATIAYLGKLYEHRESATLGTVDTFYVHGPEGLVAQVDYAANDVTTRYFVGDSLRSVTTILDDAGIDENAYFDPFGARVDANGQPAPDPDPSTTIGFTGHEEDGANLINMNARIYDRDNYRFLSPDPLVAAPLFGQSYSSYAYVFNNPMNMIDPSGMQGMCMESATCGVGAEEFEQEPPHDIKVSDGKSTNYILCPPEGCAKHDQDHSADDRRHESLVARGAALLAREGTRMSPGDAQQIVDTLQESMRYYVSADGSIGQAPFLTTRKTAGMLETYSMRWGYQYWITASGSGLGEYQKGIRAIIPDLHIIPGRSMHAEPTAILFGVENGLDMRTMWTGLAGCDTCVDTLAQHGIARGTPTAAENGGKLVRELTPYADPGVMTRASYMRTIARWAGAVLEPIAGLIDAEATGYHIARGEYGEAVGPGTGMAAMIIGVADPRAGGLLGVFSAFYQGTWATLEYLDSLPPSSAPLPPAGAECRSGRRC